MYLIRYIKRKNDTRFISRFEKHWSDDQFHGLLASEAHPVKARARPVWTGPPLGQTLGIIFSLIPWTKGLYSAQSKYYQLGFFRRVAETDEPLLFLLMIRWLDTDQNPIEKAKKKQNKTKQKQTENSASLPSQGNGAGKWGNECSSNPGGFEWEELFGSRNGNAIWKSISIHSKGGGGGGRRRYSTGDCHGKKIEKSDSVGDCFSNFWGLLDFVWVCDHLFIPSAWA